MTDRLRAPTVPHNAKGLRLTGTLSPIEKCILLRLADTPGEWQEIERGNRLFMGLWKKLPDALDHGVQHHPLPKRHFIRIRAAGLAIAQELR